MQKRRPLSPFERGLAICLSLVWLGAGGLAMYLAWVQSRWGMGVAAVAALIYGAAWLRVAALSRLLTWPELVARWRRIDTPERIA